MCYTVEACKLVQNEGKFFYQAFNFCFYYEIYSRNNLSLLANGLASLCRFNLTVIIAMGVWCLVLLICTGFLGGITEERNEPNILDIGGIFPIKGKGGWQGGQVHF